MSSSYYKYYLPMNENEANERIKQLREMLKMSRDDFAQAAGLKSNQLANIEQNKQKAPAWYIEAIGKKWPTYALWLGTGMTIPEAGQISPEIEEIRQNLKKA